MGREQSPLVAGVGGIKVFTNDELGQREESLLMAWFLA